MHAIVTRLTAAALLTHALVGCYGHHALSCVQCENVPMVALSSATCCDHGSPAEEHPPSIPCKCMLSCHGGCVSLPPQKTHIDAAPPAAWFDFVVVDQTAVGQHFGSFFDWERGKIQFAHQPPLRLHLLYQSLLI
jgi:hypothetical protein